MADVTFVIPAPGPSCPTAVRIAAYDAGAPPSGVSHTIPLRHHHPLWSPSVDRDLSPTTPSGGGKELKTMPVPIPRQRAIPAAESGQAPAAQPGGTSKDENSRKEATVDNNAATTNLTLLLIEDDPGGSAVVPELQDAAGRPIRVRTARNLTEA